MDKQTIRFNVQDQRSVLALRLKPVISAKAKENNRIGADITNTGLQNSVKAINTQKELAKVAGVSHDTINYNEAHFDLDRWWDGYDNVYAMWYTDDTHVQKSEIVDGVTVIPQEVLTRPGVLRMNLCADKVENGVLVARNTSYPIDVLRLSKAKV